MNNTGLIRNPPILRWPRDLHKTKRLPNSNMKIVFFLFIAVLLSSVAFSQNQEDEVRLSSKEMDERIIKRQYPDVPESVREYHATGTIVLRVGVDKEGIVKNVRLVRGINRNVDEYLEKTISNWRFNPLVIDEKKTSFRGVIAVQFCYGSFGSCY